MKILVLGLDNSILDKSSALTKRAEGYSNLAEKYTVVVPSKQTERLSWREGKMEIYGVKIKNKVGGLFKIYRFVKELLKKEEYDIISTQDQYYLGFIALRLVRKFKIGLEIQLHGFEKYSGLRKLIAKYVIPRANSVRCVSQRLKKQLIDEFGVGEDKITVVSIFIDSSLRGVNAAKRNERRGNLGNKLTNEIASPSARNDKFIFLTVGRLVPVKNIEMQIRAMAEVVKKYKKTELWIVGEGEESKNLEVRSKKLGVENYIKFLGWQNDLEKFYSQADAFLLTSNYEGWGLVVIEAASHGLPIIMTDVGCAREVIKDRESGIIIFVGGQKELESAMIKLVEDENLRKKLGENARKAILNLLSKEEALNLYKKSWELALKNK